MAQEIKSALRELDYLFVSVSSCGTIIGLSKYLKDSYPNLKVIGVDIEGSMIFSDIIRQRYISGIGSSRKPFFELKGLVDDYISLNHQEIVTGCNQLFSDSAIFGGGSSGACYMGAHKYLTGKEIPANSKVLIICPDSGVAYIDNIYCSTWAKNMK